MGTLEKQLEKLKSEQIRYEVKLQQYIDTGKHRNSITSLKNSLNNVKNGIKTCTQLIKIRNQFKERNPI